MRKYIYELKDLPEGEQLHFGGKATSLGRLSKWGCPVPAGYAIAAEAFAADGHMESEYDGTDAGDDHFRKQLRKDFREELSRLVESMPKGKYAVRSSAVGEDGAKDSFAGAYETILNVETKDMVEAVWKVAASALDDRVEVYAGERGVEAGKIAVVIQRMVQSEYAGVLFTADVISGNRTVMNGQYVKGLGEKLVSGEGVDGSFWIHTFPYAYDGAEAMKPYAKTLYRLAAKIAEKNGRPQDIEWGIEGGKVYILQARPITTLFENDVEGFDINDSLMGEVLLSKTNVGEIFLRPVSPATYGMLNGITKVLEIPLISNVCGQLYMNISGLCSVVMSFGVSKKKAYEILKGLVGGIPEGIDIPVFPYDKKPLLKKGFKMVLQSLGHKDKGFAERMPKLSEELIAKIRQAKVLGELKDLWEEECNPFIQKALPAIVAGVSVKPLFGTRQKLEEVCGSELTDRLLSDCSENGTIESLGSLMALDDLANGRMDAETYVSRFGHRHTDEMELAAPYPYEDPNFPENAVRDYLASGMNVAEMKKSQELRQSEAEQEFAKKYPGKVRWYQKLKKKYSKAVFDREQVRSNGLRLFCVIREFYLKVGELTGITEDIFMLYPEEMLDLLGKWGECVNQGIGDSEGGTSESGTFERGTEDHRQVREKIGVRKERYEKQMKMPYFPNLICGRFVPEEWEAAGSPGGYYRFGETFANKEQDMIKGVAGSCGQVEGVARVLFSMEEAQALKPGEILVVPAANIGWVKVFPKIAGLVTDIGAPLSHAVIVARELGIPAVVSCQSASSEIKTGDRIIVDGTMGVVRKVTCL